MHRQIAEFLAAQYISGLLDKGLPLERILALVTGFDGELVPSFRNFVSWLAVHNKQARKRLSQLNPSGLIYDGDRQTYSADEKAGHRAEPPPGVLLEPVVLAFGVQGAGHRRDCVAGT